MNPNQPSLQTQPSYKPQSQSSILTQQRFKSLFQLLLIAGNYGLGNFYFGYMVVHISSLEFSTIMKLYNIQIDEKFAQGIVVGCISIGAGIGSFFSHLLINNFSRRQCIFVINTVAFIAGLLIFCQSFSMLLIIRSIQGVCVGAYSSIMPVLIKQIIPVEVSGKLGILAQFFITFGCLFGFVFQYLLQKITGDESGQKIWIYVFGFPLVTIVTQTVLTLFYFNFETPKYLIQKQQYAKAKQLIALIYKPQYVEQVYIEKLKDSHKMPKSSSIEVLAVDSLNQNQNKQQSNSVQKPTPARARFIAIYLSVFQQFTGVNAIVIYGGQTISTVYSSLQQVFPIIINLIQVVNAFASSFLLERWGRKILIQVGTVLNIIMTFIIGFGFAIYNQDGSIQQNSTSIFLIIFGLIFFMIFFSLTLGPLVWMYVPEIAQPRVVGIATATNWSGSTLIMILFPILKSKLLNDNPSVLFFFFSAYSIMSLYIQQKYIIQTKDKTQKQIRQQFEQAESQQNRINGQKPSNQLGKEWFQMDNRSKDKHKELVQSQSGLKQRFITNKLRQTTDF